VRREVSVGSGGAGEGSGAGLFQVVFARPAMAYARAVVLPSAEPQLQQWIETSKSSGNFVGIGIVVLTKQKIVARMRVSERTRQPAGLLHGGVSALIGEELGSIASAINLAPKPIVGTTIHATHLSGAKIGDMLIAVCTPVKSRGNMQMWRTDIFLDEEQTDESQAFNANPLYHIQLRPKGRLIATCELTAQGLNKPTAKL
jgi:uncharacterized protein (TIGR00369 family)